jgi:hypothetical protein
MVRKSIHQQGGIWIELGVREKDYIDVEGDPSGFQLLEGAIRFLLGQVHTVDPHVVRGRIRASQRNPFLHQMGDEIKLTLGHPNV